MKMFTFKVQFLDESHKNQILRGIGFWKLLKKFLEFEVQILPETQPAVDSSHVIKEHLVTILDSSRYSKADLTYIWECNGTGP